MAEGPDISHGWTIAFGSSSWAPQITDIQPPGASRDAFDVSHQGTTTYRPKLLDDLVTMKELTFSGWYYAGGDVPIEEAAEVITMTAPDGTTLVFTGGITDWQPDAPHGQVMTFTCTIALTTSVVVNPPGAGTSAGSGTFEL